MIRGNRCSRVLFQGDRFNPVGEENKNEPDRTKKSPQAQVSKAAPCDAEVRGGEKIDGSGGVKIAEVKVRSGVAKERREED
ncbi:MAG: hypothetical protein FJ143_16575 [Deltaproteobacteria bacterium]|nr:hypothetical protein [Deltaproteobacteria bacterium]